MKALTLIFAILFSVGIFAQDISYSHIYGSHSTTGNTLTSSYLVTDTDADMIFTLPTNASVNCILPDPRLFAGRNLRVKRTIPSTSQIYIISPSGATTDTVICISEGMTVTHFNSPYSGFTIVHNVELKSNGSTWDVFSYR